MSCGSPFLCIRSHDILANAHTVRIHMCACAGACPVSACLSIKAVDYIDSFRNCAIAYVYFARFLLLAKGYICKHSVLFSIKCNNIIIILSGISIR